MVKNGKEKLNMTNPDQAADLASQYHIKQKRGSVWLAEEKQTGKICLIRPLSDFSQPDVAGLLKLIRHPGVPQVYDVWSPVSLMKKPRTYRKPTHNDSPEHTVDPEAEHMVDSQDEHMVNTENKTDDAYNNSWISESDISYTAGNDLAQPLVIHEYIAGLSLRDKMNQRLLKKESTKTHQDKRIRQALRWMFQGSGILSFLHCQQDQPLLHLDIKPENLVITETQRLALIDFSSSMLDFSKIENRWQSGLSITPAYAAPELLAGKPCPASDVYALALSMLEWISGASVSVCRNQTSLVLAQSLPRSYHDLFTACLSSEPSDRPDSSGELADQLQYLISKFRPSTEKRKWSEKFKKKKIALHNQINQSETDSSFNQSETDSSFNQSETDSSFNQSETDSSFNQSETDSSFNQSETDSSFNQSETDSSFNQSDVSANPAGSQVLDKKVLDHRNKGVSSYPFTQQKHSKKLTVFGNAAFGCELAAIMAETGPVLVIEADWFNPISAQLLSLENKTHWLAQNNQTAGLDQALSDIRSGQMNAERLRMLCESGVNKNIWVLAPKRDLHYYEQYRGEDFSTLIFQASHVFSNIIILVNAFIYDLYTCLGLILADQVLVPVKACKEAFQKNQRVIHFLRQKNVLQRENIYYVAYPYEKEYDLSWHSMQAITHARVLGLISENKERRRRQNDHKRYCQVISKKNQTEYLKLLKSLAAEETGKLSFTDVHPHDVQAVSCAAIGKKWRKTNANFNLSS